MARRRLTDDMSDFDMRQMLLVEDGIRRYEPVNGRAGARRRAAEEMPLVFDLPALDDAARDGSPMLPSMLAAVLGGLSRRSDWPARRAGFTGAEREAHLAEARQRVAMRSAQGG